MPHTGLVYLHRVNSAIAAKFDNTSQIIYPVYYTQMLTSASFSASFNPQERTIK